MKNKKKLRGFSYYKNIANFEAFWQDKNFSKNLLFLGSEVVLEIYMEKKFKKSCEHLKNISDGINFLVFPYKTLSRPGLYMIGYGKGKNILKFPPFFRLNKENQEREIQNQIKTKTFLFMFSFDIMNFPDLDFPRSIWRKAGISKYFFLFRTLSYTTLVSTA